MGAASFNADISKWDTSKVTDMRTMFWSAREFNQDISKWDVSKVEDMSYMFSYSPSFNADISHWDVSKVKLMESMFSGASSFKQKLCGKAWVYSKAKKESLFENSPGKISWFVCSPPSSSQRWLAQWRTSSALAAASPSTLSVASANMQTCSKCGTFKRSTRISCCAPGGAWYGNCGGANDKNFGHSWLEGMETCKRKTQFDGCSHMLIHAH